MAATWTWHDQSNYDNSKHNMLHVIKILMFISFISILFIQILIFYNVILQLNFVLIYIIYYIETSYLIIFII